MADDAKLNPGQCSETEGTLQNKENSVNNSAPVYNPTDDDNNNYYNEPDLVHILTSNKLYDYLYDTLRENDIGYDELDLLQKHEIEEICKEMNLTKIQTLKFRKLIKIIQTKNISTNNEAVVADEKLKQFLNKSKLPMQLYHILLKQGIGYKQIASITPYDIDKLWENNNINIGAKINLKNAVHQLQFEILQQQNKEIERSNIPCTPGQVEAKSESKYFDVDLDAADYKLKVILIGDSAVGKTSIIDRYINDRFRNDLVSTVGYCNLTKRETLSDGTVAELNIWDTAGEERYNMLNADFYHNADIIIICYGIDSKITFDNKEKWRQQIEKHAKKDVVVFLVGCKADVHTNRRAVKAQGRQIINQAQWKKYNAWFCECSAKSGDNINNIFTTATHLIIKKHKQQKVIYQFQENEEIKCICGEYLRVSNLKYEMVCSSCNESSDHFWHCVTDHKNINIHDKGFNICKNCIKHHKKSISTHTWKENENRKIKIVLVGNSGVGKSALIARYVEDSFMEVVSTMGVDFKKKIENLSDGTKITLQIWDTAGQERFRSVIKSYYRDADVIMLCYAIDDSESLDNCTWWKTEITENNIKEDTLFFLIGCKSDFDEGNWLEEWQNEYHWWSECSAKTGENVTHVFNNAAEMVMIRRRATNILINTTLLRQGIINIEKTFDTEQKEKQSGCCSII